MDKLSSERDKSIPRPIAIIIVNTVSNNAFFLTPEKISLIPIPIISVRTNGINGINKQLSATVKKNN